MRINIKKVGERYLITDDAGIRLIDTGLKGKEVWQHYFDVRYEQACGGKETSDESGNCIKPVVSKCVAIILHDCSPEGIKRMEDKFDAVDCETGIILFTGTSEECKAKYPDYVKPHFY